MKGAKLAVALALALGFSSSASSSSILVMPPDLDRSQQDFVDKYFGEGGYSQLISEKELEDYYSTFSRELLEIILQGNDRGHERDFCLKLQSKHSY